MLRSQDLTPDRSASEFRFGIVAAQYNPEFTDAMLQAALQTLTGSGVLPANLRVVRVPGSYEIPVLIAQMASSGKFDALIALGVILRGETAHADLIGESVTHRLSEISVEHRIPVIHEVLLVDTEFQARERCLNPKHNRGGEAARTAIFMADALKRLKAEMD
jgi:6,7-dimethyl-8-ribityllumazine synthase